MLLLSINWQEHIYFQVFPWLIPAQLCPADDSFGRGNLPAPTYSGGQVAGQMPSSSATQWRISTFLTGQMSHTWQSCHPDSPAENLQTGYHSLPEIKSNLPVLESFADTFPPPPVCFHLAGPTFNSSHTVKWERRTRWPRHWSLMRGRTLDLSELWHSCQDHCREPLRPILTILIILYSDPLCIRSFFSLAPPPSRSESLCIKSLTVVLTMRSLREHWSVSSRWHRATEAEYSEGPHE